MNPPLPATDQTSHSHRLRRLGEWLLPALTAWLLMGCEASNPGADMSGTTNMNAVVDLAVGPSCGKIVLCIIQCGLGKIECSAQCAAGANATEATKAGALAFCAALNCAKSDAGTGFPAILGCLLSSCRSELTSCDGLPLI